MTDVENLFRAYVAGHRGGDGPSEHDFLSQVEGVDRDELAAMIDAYLTRAPRRAWDPSEFEASGAAPFVQSVARSLQGSAGLWPTLLPRLRTRVRIARKDLVGELADRLGVTARQDKVERYYHQMEQGLLPSDGVSDSVLEALGAILGESREALRRAGQSLGPAGGPGGPDAVFARTAVGTGVEADVAAGAPAPRAAEDEWDEIDRLFRGG
jgi:hypothetical protein